GQARNFESTLRGLADKGHEVHMSFDRPEKKNLPGHSDLAQTLVQEYPGITSAQAPRPTKDEWSLISSRLRAALDYMRYLRPEFKDAPKLRRRAEKFAPDRVERLVSSTPRPARPALRSAFKSAERSAPISETVEDYLLELNPDVVLVTPLLEPGTIQVEF